MSDLPYTFLKYTGEKPHAEAAQEMKGILLKEFNDFGIRIDLDPTLVIRVNPYQINDETKRLMRLDNLSDDDFTNELGDAYDTELAIIDLFGDAGFEDYDFVHHLDDLDL